MNYLWGAVLTVGSEVSIGLANVLDGQLSRRTFSSVWSIVILNGLLNILVLPLFYVILKPSVIPIDQLYLVLIVALLEFSYQIPYYKALRKTETSIVVMLFNIEKIFIAVLAFYFLNEKLKWTQYVGFSLVILCSTLATFDISKFRLNRSFFYMVLACIILAVDETLQKHSLNQIDWRTFYFWLTVCSVPFNFIILFSSRLVKSEILDLLKAPQDKKYLPLYFENIVSWISQGLAIISLSLLPITIKKIFESIPSITAHLIASKGSKALNIDDREWLSLKRIILLALAGCAGFLAFWN
jgi:uncharacterized membrane protein